MTTTPDFNAAAAFMAASARVLDRRVFQRLFAHGPAETVRDAIAAYRNDDGGFGHALEPDLRTGASQPAATEMALRLMDSAGCWDNGLAKAACDWLMTVAPSEGGATFVLPSMSDAPHAPWWVLPEDRPASPIQTGQIAGTLHARGFSHPWLDRATELMWELIDALDAPGAYEMFGVLAFLQHVPDRDRAARTVRRVGSLLLERGLVALDPEAAGEVHGPLDFAPFPDSVARPLFEDTVIQAHLDSLAAAQRADGGWMFNWPSWSPAAEADWRGYLTVDALRILRANGRSVTLRSCHRVSNASGGGRGTRGGGDHRDPPAAGHRRRRGRRAGAVRRGGRHRPGDGHRRAAEDARRPADAGPFPASGGLGFGLPAAVGVALGQPDRPVTAGVDFTKIAAGYGVQAVQAAGDEHLRSILAEMPEGPRLVQVDTVTTAPNG